MHASRRTPASLYVDDMVECAWCTEWYRVVHNRPENTQLMQEHENNILLFQLTM